jgi:hypothetical protein
VELLVDQVVVTNEEVEIRYVMPTSPNGARQPLLSIAFRLSRRSPSRTTTRWPRRRAASAATSASTTTTARTKPWATAHPLRSMG